MECLGKHRPCFFMEGSYENCENAAWCFYCMGGCKSIRIPEPGEMPKVSMEEAIRSVQKVLGGIQI